MSSPETKTYKVMCHLYLNEKDIPIALVVVIFFLFLAVILLSNSVKLSKSVVHLGMAALYAPVLHLLESDSFRAEGRLVQCSLIPTLSFYKRGN